MKFFATVTSATFFLVGVFAQQNGVTVNSLEGVTLCRPSLISWSGGTPPYFLVNSIFLVFSQIKILLSILPASQPNAPPLVDFGRQTGTSVTWLVNLQAGTTAYLNLRDNTGAVGQSAPFTVANSTDSSCLSRTLSASSGPSVSNTGTASNTPTASGSPVASPSASPSAAAAISQFHVGAAAVLGAAVLAFAA